ncbi:hypothetical protein ACFSLT_01315 [Novosphingobium resinovorum]
MPAAANGDARMVVLLTRAGAANLVMSGKPPAATLAVPVPEGFGYAVIDPASLEVLQHSDPARAHNETFGSQLDAVDTLSRIAGSVDERCGLADAAQHGRAAEPTAGAPFDARYGGKRVRMSIGVACSAHWLVATWYDRSKLQRAALDPAFVAGVTMLCVGLVLAAGLGVMASTDPRSLLRKLWPDPEPFHSAEADQWYLRGMSAQLAVVVLMAAGLLLARGDAAFLHAALGLFLLLILLARKDADHSWGTLPVGWGKVATVFYAALGIYASVVLACRLGANWRAFAYPVLLVAMWIVAALDWFSLRKIDVRLPAWMERMRAAPAGFVPPSVMRRVNRVLRHQLVTIYLLAVIPALAACCAGLGSCAPTARCPMPGCCSNRARKSPTTSRRCGPSTTARPRRRRPRPPICPPASSSPTMPSPSPVRLRRWPPRSCSCGPTIRSVSTIRSTFASASWPTTRAGRRRAPASRSSPCRAARGWWCCATGCWRSAPWAWRRS